MDPDRPPAAMLQALCRMGLLRAGESVGGVALTGGVSSDIWRIDLPDGPICVKRALAKLRVAADWQAPVIRNLYEARWMRRAAQAVPDAVPALLGQDQAAGMLAMAYLPPAENPLWKARLHAGDADPAFASRVGGVLAAIHAATAADPSVPADFPTDDIFFAIRLEPYLLAAAQAHPDRAPALRALVDSTAGTRRALVHGDASPKNILCGPRGPVLLDAECAWWGDPAFDLAFCLNHLLLKCLWTPAATDDFLRCYAALAAAYLSGVDWEPPAALETRAARLLPGLLLARVDGKSPVEYITTEAGRAIVRRVARGLLAAPAERLAAIGAAWKQELPA